MQLEYYKNIELQRLPLKVKLIKYAKNQQSNNLQENPSAQKTKNKKKKKFHKKKMKLKTKFKEKIKI